MDDAGGTDRWYFGERYYALTLASDVARRDGIALELDDVAPAPGRGTMLEVFRDDAAQGQLSFTAFATEPLPLALIEQFIVEARQTLMG